jgi:hypothetical protein
MYDYTFFHGNALVRLVKDKRPFRIRLYSGNNGYSVNDSAYIYLKHCSKRLSPWRFTFLPKHIKEINKARKNIPTVYIVLICNDDGICCLSFDEFSQLVFVGDFSESKWISVSRSPREKYTVSGSDGKLKYKIGNSDFPEKILSE